jgi:DNA-binding LacI/PurR family transcriptional regulator
LLEQEPRITAIFCTNDKMALGAIHYLNRQGVRIPQQISVVGFDDTRHAAFVNPSLTTVHLPLYEVGVLACERLIERVHGRTEKVAERLATHLVVRESTAMVPALQN